MRLCSGPGCGRAVPDDVRFCDECKTDNGGLPEKPSGWDRAKDDPLLLQYQSKRWNKGVRPRVIQKYPVCVGCGRTASAVADHEVPARLIVAVCRAERLFPFDPWGGFYIMANLRGRCHSCHNSKSKTEDTDDWTVQLNEVLAPYRADKQRKECKAL